VDDPGDPSGRQADSPGGDDYGVGDLPPWADQHHQADSDGAPVEAPPTDELPVEAPPLDDPVQNRQEDDDGPIPEPTDDEIIEPKTAKEEIISDLQTSFAEGAGPFETAPDETFLAESWFDFDYLDRYETVSMEWVNKPYAYVSVLYDPVIDEYRYHVGKPTLDEFEQYVRQDLEGVLRDILMYEEIDPSQSDEEVVSDAIRSILEEYTDRVAVGTLSKIYYYLLRDSIGMDKIDPIMADPAVEDISCVGDDVAIFVYHGDYRDLRTNVAFEREELASFVSKMAARAGKHISVANPIVDASLPDGSRVQLTLGREVSARGSNFTVRKFSSVPHTPLDLINWGAWPLDAIAFIWLAIQNDMSMLFAGGTASGKTTAMNAMSFFIPPNSKVVSIEDTREVTLPHDNWIQSVSRRSFTGESGGEIGTYGLLQSALRQRPEYLIVGEIRTEQDVALTFFQAISTGHTGYTTFHADSVETVLDRLRNPPLDVPEQLLRSLDLVTVQKQQFVDGNRVRRLSELVELSRTNSGELKTHTLFSWDPATDSFEFHGQSRVRERIKRNRGWNDVEFDRQLDERRRLLRYLIDNEQTSYEAATTAIHAYGRRPDAVIEAVDDGTFQPGG